MCIPIDVALVAADRCWMLLLLLLLLLLVAAAAALAAAAAVAVVAVAVVAAVAVPVARPLLNPRRRLPCPNLCSRGARCATPRPCHL